MANMLETIWGKNTRRIWLAGEGPEVNVFALFCRKFVLEKELQNLTLRIAAEKDFLVMLDGQEIGRGQFSDDPMVKTHTDYVVDHLAAGPHVLLVRNYFCGVDTQNSAPGLPGILVRLFGEGFELVSDGKWCGRLDPQFRNGPMPKSTPQLGFTAEMDAHQALDYAALNGEETGWSPVQEFLPDSSLRYAHRPLAAWPKLGNFVAAEGIRTGRFFKMEGIPEETPACHAFLDMLYWDNVAPEKDAEGGYVIEQNTPTHHPTPEGRVLLGKLPEETSGFLSFAITAPEGTIVDLAYGEHIFDGRVRSYVEKRNFANRFICKAGLNQFELPFLRIAANYLELHIHMPNFTTAVVHRFGVRSWDLSLSAEAPFDCSDSRLLAIRERSIRTLKLCMHEHYEDCPWREQALYTYDSRNQMLFGYYLWGNWDYAAVSLGLWRESQKPDGFLRICAPMRGNLVIPMFCFIYPIQLWEHLLYSGEDVCARQNYDIAQRIVDHALGSKDPATGLPVGPDPKAWFFYEWVPELFTFGCPEGEIQALYSLYLLEALDAMAKIGNYIQKDVSVYQAEAAKLRELIIRHFWNEEEGCYYSRIKDGKGYGLLHEHVQLMMFYTGCVPVSRKERMFRFLKAGKSIPITFSVMPYLGRLSLGEDGAFFREILRERLEKDYYGMLKHTDLNTVFETPLAAQDFYYLGSLCHGWSALPVFYAKAILLGVVPLEPGFRSFRVMPWDGGLSHASGTIPTRHGEIKVAWTKQPDGSLRLQVSHPEGLKCQVVSLPECPVAE